MATELKPEIKDGMSQSERYLSSLNPAYFSIDEKDITDQLKLITDLSGQFNYYNFSNQAEGDWKDFLTTDVDIIISLLSKPDNHSMMNEYKKLSDQLRFAENEVELRSALNRVFQFMLDFTKLLLEYHHGFERAAREGHSHPFETQKEAFITHFEQITSYKKNAEILFDQQIGILPFDRGGSARERVIRSVSYFDQLVSDLNIRYATLLQTARQYMIRQTTAKTEHDPHIALLISFLHLNLHLQEPVNQLMKKHLDYFYQDIIGIQRKKENQDRIHIVIEPAAITNPLFLNKGEEIVVEVAGYQEKLHYELENNVQLSAVEIKELKTLFVSNRIQVGNKTSYGGAVKERQVYKGDYAPPHPSTFEKERALFPVWPLLGEDQAELALQQRTMQEADLGLLLASPLFYQPDGNRAFSIKFFIARESFNAFEKHIKTLSEASSISTEVLNLEVLNQSFIISITGENGWLNIDKYKVSRSPAESAVCFIEVKFSMDITAEAIAVYNRDSHGADLNIKWPVVKLLLNNLSFHNPYTFLSYFIIERVNIQVHVNESKQFRLKNNLGPLFSDAPFQPFGPVPVAGAYLDIKNTTIFNRYNTGFCLSIYWFDLPREKDGFSEYYNGYDYPFSNQAFKVQLNSKADAKATPAVDETQVFQLFEEEEKNGNQHLQPSTTISGIDFRRIKFENGLLVDKELEEAGAHFTQGTIRMELISPDEAFGHRIYPKIFTNTVEHNARRFVRNRPIPNPPFVPLIKSLSIDYTLEHSELTNGTAYTDEEEMVMFHIHPFGYDQFYKGKNAERNLFAPEAGHESNLLIGLAGLVPDQELSLFFQLSEENFHHTIHEPEEVQWSHLVNNKWIAIDKAAVLQDTTENFVNSGIITLKIPLWIEKNNTILNPDLNWIRASLPGKSTVNAKVIAVFVHAAVAIRIPGQLDFPPHSYNLAAGSAKGFNRTIPGINGLKQLFPSFGGQPAESPHQYNIRVSERLRHKQRLLSILDISQAVLDAFPQILMVKCYSTASNRNMILPGVDVHVIVIPREREDGSFVSQEPRVSLALLYKIKKFISHWVSDFVKVEVGNPIYERIMVVATVKFKNNDKVHHSNGYFLKLMNQDIREYISAWLYDARRDFQIGSKIYVSEILNYLQNKPYIDYITGFSLLHFYKIWNKVKEDFDACISDTAVDLTDSLKGSIPGAILISAEEHLLSVTDTATPLEPDRSGIERFSIGSDLLINHETGKEKKMTKPEVRQPANLYNFTVYTK